MTDDCVPETFYVHDKGLNCSRQTVCLTHTYFGNGIEPNNWPCHPETRSPQALPTGERHCGDCNCQVGCEGVRL